MTPAKELSSEHRNGKRLELPRGVVTVTALWSSGPTSDSAVTPPPARCTADAGAAGPPRVGSGPPPTDGAAQLGAAGNLQPRQPVGLGDAGPARRIQAGGGKSGRQGREAAQAPRGPTRERRPPGPARRRPARRRQAGRSSGAVRAPSRSAPHTCFCPAPGDVARTDWPSQCWRRSRVR